MKKTIDLGDFKREFELCGRSNQFSNAGLVELFDYLEAIEQDCGEEMELDVIAICCDYVEYENLETYNSDYEPCDSIDDIRELTTVIPIDDESFIIQIY